MISSSTSQTDFPKQVFILIKSQKIKHLGKSHVDHNKMFNYDYILQWTIPSYSLTKTSERNYLLLVNSKVLKKLFVIWN